MDVDFNITDLRRLEQQQENRTSIIVCEVLNGWQRRLILNSVKKLKQYKNSVYVSNELSLADAQLKTQLLR